MMDYNARHQNLPEMDAFLRQANSDVKDSLLDPAKYTADRMERLRSALSAGQAIRAVAQPVEELPDIAEDLEDDIEEAPAQERPDSAARLTSEMFQNLQLYQSPYANRSRGVLSSATRARVNSPLLRRMTTIMDVATPGGGEEDGELPEVPLSQVQNRRELKVPYEPEPQDPYTFPQTDHQFP